jgi:hypothetical protein
MRDADARNILDDTPTSNVQQRKGLEDACLQAVAANLVSLPQHLLCADS